MWERRPFTGEGGGETRRIERGRIERGSTGPHTLSWQTHVYVERICERNSTRKREHEKRENTREGRGQTEREADQEFPSDHCP